MKGVPISGQDGMDKTFGSKIFQRRLRRHDESSTAPQAAASDDCFKTFPMLDGHHRVHVLRERNIDVDALPREIRAVDSHE